jgi:hypothetical protein
MPSPAGPLAARMGWLQRSAFSALRRPTAASAVRQRSRTSRASLPGYGSVSAGRARAPRGAEASLRGARAGRGQRPRPPPEVPRSPPPWLVGPQRTGRRWRRPVRHRRPPPVADCTPRAPPISRRDGRAPCSGPFPVAAGCPAQRGPRHPRQPGRFPRLGAAPRSPKPPRRPRTTGSPGRSALPARRPTVSWRLPSAHSAFVCEPPPPQPVAPSGPAPRHARWAPAWRPAHPSPSPGPCRPTPRPIGLRSTRPPTTTVSRTAAAFLREPEGSR